MAILVRSTGSLAGRLPLAGVLIRDKGRNGALIEGRGKLLVLLQLLGQLAELGKLDLQTRVAVLSFQTRMQFKCIYWSNFGHVVNWPWQNLLIALGLLESDELMDVGDLSLGVLHLNSSAGRREVVLEKLRLVVALDGGEILRRVPV